MAQKKDVRGWRIQKLRALYDELSADFTLIEHEAIEVSFTDGSKTQSRRVTSIGGKRVNNCYYKDRSIRVLHKLPTEYVYGSLYASKTTGSTVGQSVDFEWALVFKLDCDLARQKTGSIDAALEMYAEDSFVLKVIGDKASDKGSEVKPTRKFRKKRGNAGRPKKTNYRDMLERYAGDPEAMAWLRKVGSDPFRSAQFSHDNYEDQILANAVPVESLDSFNDNARQWREENRQFLGPRRSKPKDESGKLKKPR